MSANTILDAVVGAIAEGERARGTGGVVVYTDETDVRYVMVHELETEELREAVADMLSDEGDEYVFALNRAKDMHIWKISRFKIAELLSGDAASARG